MTGSWGGGGAELWDIENGARLKSYSSENYDYKVLAASFSSDGEKILTAGYRKEDSLILWDVATGEKLQTFAGHMSSINSMTFSPDGSWLLTGTTNGGVLWNITIGKILRTFIVPGHNSSVEYVAFSPDEKLIFIGNGCGEIIQDAETGEMIAYGNHFAAVVAVNSYNPFRFLGIFPGIE